MVIVFNIEHFSIKQLLTVWWQGLGTDLYQSLIQMSHRIPSFSPREVQCVKIEHNEHSLK